MISFVSVFPPYRGGIAKFSDYLYRSLSEHDEVTAYNFRKLYPDLLFPGRSQTITYQRARYALPLLHSMNPYNWLASARKIAEKKPEALIYSYWHPFFSPALWVTIRKIRQILPNISVIGIAHNVLPHEYFPFQIRLSGSLFKQSDHVVLLSHQTLLEFRALRHGDKYIKLFHPVYNQKIPSRSKYALRKKYDIEEEATVLIFFGIIRKYKGLDIFIKALNKLDLHRLKICPLIVGEFYTDKQELLSLIKAEHLSQYKVIDRFVSDQEAAEYLSLSDAMVLPYRQASQSGVLSNAINFRLPVIISDLPGLREHITPGETGLVFKNKDIDSLARSIKKFTQNRLNQQMSENMEKLKQRLTWQRFAGELYDLIQKPRTTS